MKSLVLSSWHTPEVVDVNLGINVLFVTFESPGIV